MTERRGYLDPLPMQWIDKIFERLTVRYGTAFAARYAGLELLAVRNDWADQLAGYQANPKAIAFALDSLPADKPPTATQFRDLCRLAPPAPAPQLPGPAPARAQPERLAAAMAKLRMASMTSLRDAAEALRQREIEQQRNPRSVTRFQRLTLAQRQSWRQALGWPLNWPADQEPPKPEAVT